MLSKKKAGFLFLFLLLMLIEGTTLLARGICNSRGGGHVNVHYHGYYGRKSNMDDIMMLFMLSSTSTTIYCISFDDDELWYDSKKRRRSQYSQLNYEQLKEDGARGSGEHLAVLSGFLGCPVSSQKYFSSVVQQNYQDLFPPEKNRGKKVLLLKLGTMIQTDINLRKVCIEPF